MLKKFLLKLRFLFSSKIWIKLVHNGMAIEMLVTTNEAMAMANELRSKAYSGGSREQYFTSLYNTLLKNNEKYKKKQNRLTQRVEISPEHNPNIVEMKPPRLIMAPPAKITMEKEEFIKTLNAKRNVPMSAPIIVLGIIAIGLLLGGFQHDMAVPKIKEQRTELLSMPPGLSEKVYFRTASQPYCENTLLVKYDDNPDLPESKIIWVKYWSPHITCD